MSLVKRDLQGNFLELSREKRALVQLSTLDGSSTCTFARGSPSTTTFAVRQTDSACGTFCSPSLKGTRSNGTGRGVHGRLTQTLQQIEVSHAGQRSTSVANRKYISLDFVSISECTLRALVQSSTRAHSWRAGFSCLRTARLRTQDSFPQDREAQQIDRLFSSGAYRGQQLSFSAACRFRISGTSHRGRRGFATRCLSRGCCQVVLRPYGQALEAVLTVSRAF